MGIIPELVPHERLSQANAFLETGSTLAILLGMVAGAILLPAAEHIGVPAWTGGLVLAVVAGLGLLGSLTIPPVPVARAEGGLIATIRLGWSSIRADRVLRLTIIGQVLVWSIASLVPAPIIPYASKFLGLEPEWAILPMVALGLGIAGGCVLAGRLSGDKVEYGLLPLGALGLTLATLAFAAIGPNLPGLLVIMTAMGISAGLTFVPLNALLQARSPSDRRGAILAMSNTLVYLGMLAGSGLALGLGVTSTSPRGGRSWASPCSCSPVSSGR